MTKDFVKREKLKKELGVNTKKIDVKVLEIEEKEGEGKKMDRE